MRQLQRVHEDDHFPLDDVQTQQRVEEQRLVLRGHVDVELLQVCGRRGDARLLEFSSFRLIVTQLWRSFVFSDFTSSLSVAERMMF